MRIILFVFRLWMLCMIYAARTGNKIADTKREVFATYWTAISATYLHSLLAAITLTHILRFFGIWPPAWVGIAFMFATTAVVGILVVRSKSTVEFYEKLAAEVSAAPPSTYIWRTCAYIALAILQVIGLAVLLSFFWDALEAHTPGTRLYHK